MRRTLILPALLCALLCALAPVARAGQTNEAQLDKILQSKSSSVREKSAACAQLKRIATGRSVRALAALLTDEQLSHSARYVLESMPEPRAGAALRRALSRTSGQLQVGIINSIATRRDTDAVRDLGKLLSKQDQAVAAAAAGALGRLGGGAAVKFLQASLAGSSGSVHQAEADALLNCASHLLNAGDHDEALKLFDGLYKGGNSEPVRYAAFRGMILASGQNGVALAFNAIASGDAVSRSAALHVAAQLPGTEATRDLADLAIGAKVPVQLALIECLVARNDPAASPVITRLADSGDLSVRLAATAALGSLGDDSSVELLAGKAATSRGAERNAARQSLLELNRGPVTKRMLALVNPASPKVETELIIALGGRGDQTATPALLNLASQGNDTERSAALQALGSLADASQIPSLVQLVANAGSDDLRAQAADALGAIYQRTPSATGSDVKPLVNAVTSGSIETRLALLPICSPLAQESVRSTVRAAMTDSDARIRDAAVHALCDTHDPELLQDILDLADGKNGETNRHLAIRGCVHLTSQEDDVRIPDDKKLDAFAKILGQPLDAAEKRLVLSGLAAVANERALALSVGLMSDAEVQPEAEQAVIKICQAIRGKHPAKARAALKKVEAESKSADNRQSAKDILDKMK